MTLGETLKSLREAQGLYQRHIAAKLEVDTAFISKVEKDEKRINRDHLTTLAKLFNIPEDDLQKLWIADKLYKIVEDEALATEALHAAEEQVIYRRTKKMDK